MAAETLNCPMCGASVRTDAPNCEHCGARLATVACPACFGMMFLGSKFCSHCGAAAARAVEPTSKVELCPRCSVSMEGVEVGGTTLRECNKCHGVWVDPVMLEQVCTNNEKQVALLGNTSEVSDSKGRDLEQVRYLPCPVCRQLMNRIQFANCSRVIVDVCKKHGTWFDRDELRRIVEFIRTGGLLTAREREIAELEAKRKKLIETQAIMPGLAPEPASAMHASDINDVISAA